MQVIHIRLAQHRTCCQLRTKISSKKKRKRFWGRQAKQGSNPWSPDRPVDHREGRVREEGTEQVTKVPQKDQGTNNTT